MKMYTAPEVKVLAFVAEEAISATASKESRAMDGGSNLYNDAEFGAW